MLGYCPERNIAKRGRATQSSQYQSPVSADKAIDGNPNTMWKYSSCSTTTYEVNPWWRLDLFMPYKINTVKITVRKDSYHKRINGAEIRIGNSLENNGNINPR